MLDTEAAFTEKKTADGLRKGKRWYTLGLVTKKEREAKGDKYVTLADVMKLITVVDPLSTTGGILGV